MKEKESKYYFVWCGKLFANYSCRTEKLYRVFFLFWLVSCIGDRGFLLASFELYQMLSTARVIPMHWIDDMRFLMWIVDIFEIKPHLFLVISTFKFSTKKDVQEKKENKSYRILDSGLVNTCFQICCINTFMYDCLHRLERNALKSETLTRSWLF